MGGRDTPEWMQLVICLPIGAAVGIAFISFSRPQRRVVSDLWQTVNELRSKRVRQ